MYLFNNREMKLGVEHFFTRPSKAGDYEGSFMQMLLQVWVLKIIQDVFNVISSNLNDTKKVSFHLLHHVTHYGIYMLHTVCIFSLVGQLHWPCHFFFPQLKADAIAPSCRQDQHVFCQLQLYFSTHLHMKHGNIHTSTEESFATDT